MLVRLIPAPRGTGIVSAPVPKKLLMMAGIDDCYTSARGCTATLGNFGEFWGWHRASGQFVTDGAQKLCFIEAEATTAAGSAGSVKGNPRNVGFRAVTLPNLPICAIALVSRSVIVVNGEREKPEFCGFIREALPWSPWSLQNSTFL